MCACVSERARWREKEKVGQYFHPPIHIHNSIQYNTAHQTELPSHKDPFGCSKNVNWAIFEFIHLQIRKIDLLVNKTETSQESKIYFLYEVIR